MAKSYVLLTGSKNNAGDFLIKYRAKQLFAELRPDVDIIDLNAWEPLDSKLRAVNESDCLILMGGPALQREAYPKIYKLTDNLKDITVPITCMGIGWKSKKGEWEDTYNYSLSAQTIKLMSRINNDGITGSVRDYHTLNTLFSHGLKRFMMTGCPAYYQTDKLNTIANFPEKIREVGISLGVTFVDSLQMEKQMKEMVLNLKSYFKDSKLKVAFHHSLDADKYYKTHNARPKHNRKHQEFAMFLNTNGIDYIDISGSAENLIDYYSNVDLHIGYRVHAHIFMNSIRKPSILLTEDGRGKGVRSTIGGVVLDSYLNCKEDLLSKILNKCSDRFSRYIVNKNMNQELLNTIEYQQNTDWHQAKIGMTAIDMNFNQMKFFVNSLP